MALRPKLEFYTLKLVSKDLEYKTFRDFAIEELYQRRPSSDAQIMNKLFDHFMNGLVTDIAKDRRIKKQLKLTKVSHLPFYRLSRIIKHCNILIDNLLTFRK